MQGIGTYADICNDKRDALQQFLPFGRIIESKKSLEVYQHLSLESVDEAYQDAVQSVGI